jgi:uncharacterized protein (UPF0548 family)
MGAEALRPLTLAICRPVLRLRRPSENSLEELLSAAKKATFTYPEVGATRDEQMPGGYRHDRYEAPLGEGAGLFENAARALLGWQAQVGAGVEVFPRGSQVADGATVVLLLRAGLWAPAPCRVVYVINEPDMVGFAYGTLPGHPERGEAAFTLVRDGDEWVTFVVRSFSRRVDPLARLGAPLARLAQTRVTRRYIEALKEAPLAR